MSSAFKPLLRSSEGLIGYVHLLLALYFPPEDGEPIIPTDGHFKTNFLRWMSEDFICGTSFPSFAIELVSTLQMKSDCGSAGDWKSYPPAILWNAPTASITEEIFYAIWNISYPVYDWGDSIDLQKGLQEALDFKIINGELEMPWEEASIAVMGLERDTFDLPEAVFNIDDNATTTGNNITSNTTGRFREGLLSIDPVTATTVQYTGAILLVFHTIMLIVVHMVGQSYAKRKAQATEAKSPLLDAEGLDDMLLLTKDHKMQPESPSADLVLPTPYTRNKNNSRAPSPTRSFVSTVSKVSSANYVGESLFPPMESDDEISEAGTEVVIDKSIDSGSNHSISSTILEDAGSIRSSNSKQRRRYGSSIGNDDRSISKSSVGSAGSRHSFAVPLNIGTILGNVDDDEDNVSDIMLI